MIGKARRDWNAAAWMLERRYPESYDRNRLRPEPIAETGTTAETGVKVAPAFVPD